MGLDSITVPEKLEPLDEPIAERKVHQLGSNIIVTRTYHGPVYEDKENPQYIRYHLKIFSSDKWIKKKKSVIRSENTEETMKDRERIIHTAKVMNGVRNKFKDN